MPFDNTAVRALIRFLVRDPNADAINDTDLHNNFVLPAWRDWWFRMERRPRLLLPGSGVLQLGPDSRSGAFGTGGVPYIELIEAATLSGYDDGSGGLIPFVPAVDHDLTRTDLNRIRYLQESEGAVGEPRNYASQVVGSSLTSGTVYLWFYPISDAGNNPPTTAGYQVVAYGRGNATLASGATVCMTTDPVSSRYVARMAAFNLARYLDVPVRKRNAILIGMPRWVRVHFDIDRFLHAPSSDAADVPLWRQEWPAR